MTDRPLGRAGAARRGDGIAGMDGGKALRGANADDAARAAKVRRNAWLLAGLAVAFYVGYIAWMFVRANSG